MAVLIATSLRKEFSGDPLFDGVSFTVDRRDRLSLAGANGAGKTTLLRAIAGETSLQGGELALTKGARIALHDQRPPRDLGFTLREYALSGAKDLLALESELRRLEEAMASGTHDDATLRRYADAQAQLEHGGGWAWRDRVASAVRGLGFVEADLDRKLDTFSGGELTRASLARALAGDPDLLLLDEPTNHLDVESLEWLERELETLDAAVILVAHDRWFLESVTTAVLELAPGGAHYFAGPWHEWRREKAERAAAAARTAERVSVDIARLERFVERFRYKKSKAKQAQAKLTQIGRLEKERKRAAGEHESLTRKRRTLGFDFLSPPRSGRVVLEAEGISLNAGDKLLLEDTGFAVERGEKVALVGPNGSGKTTLLESMLGQHSFAEGTARLGHGVIPAYFSQHGQELPDRGSVLDTAAAATSLSRPQAQNLLGRFLFSGWETHERPVSALSGGERRRLSLALLVASGANFLVLDEPTNHLDLESREALEAALEAFPGTFSSSRTTARCWTPFPTASSRSRIARSVRTREAGPTSCACGRRRRSRSSSRSPPERRRRARPRRHAPVRRGASRPTSSSSRRASPRRRRGSRTSNGRSRTTGRTWTSSPRTAPRATSSRRCSNAGRSCSSRPSPRRRRHSPAAPCNRLLQAMGEGSGDVSAARRRTSGVHAVSLEVSGQRAAPTFASVAEACLDDVYGYLLYLTRNNAVAEDLTGETFETALRRWRRFDPRRGTPRAWLLAIARTTALDWFRADGRRRKREERAGAGESPVSTHAAFEGFSPVLEAGLQELTAGEREVVALESRPRPGRRGDRAPAEHQPHGCLDAPAPGARKARREDETR